jgi:hypothetical protein
MAGALSIKCAANESFGAASCRRTGARREEFRKPNGRGKIPCPDSVASAELPHVMRISRKK